MVAGTQRRGEMVEPSGDQIASPCEVVDECGGCALMKVPYERQRQIKLALVADALDSAGVQTPQPTWIPSEPPLAYRNRVRLRIGSNGAVGFFNPNKVVDCAVLELRLRRALGLVQRFAENHPHLTAAFSHLEIRSPDANGKASAFFSYGPKRPCALPQPHVFSELGPEFMTAIERSSSTKSTPRQRSWLTSSVYADVPLGAFRQVNDAVNRKLVEHVRQGALLRKAQSFLDLYCGSGNLSLLLAAEGMTGVGVEQHPAAVHAMRETAGTQGFGTLRVVAGEVEATVKGWTDENRAYDLVIADPPRAGLRDVAQSVAHLSRRHVVLCSCHPHGFARDLRTLVHHGFRVEELTVLDMFPQTHHVEAVAWLIRE